VSLYPALDIRNADPDLALAAACDASPLAAESTGDALVIYFATAHLRDEAEAAVRAMLPDARTERRDVDDGDWARRSQGNLGPIVVGRIVVKPVVTAPLGVADDSGDGAASGHEIVIQPSMGFGTGHHATTRLCLAALQTIELNGAEVLDVGTGSGILALAARALGARCALGVDYDPDAIQSARENLPLNPHLDGVTFELRDLGCDPLPAAPVVTANLTGALLCRAAGALMENLAAGGHLIVSGLLGSERDGVRDAFATLELVWEAREDEWVGMCFRQPIRATV
jgi:ribosomal protein L11 methyltransferase